MNVTFREIACIFAGQASLFAAQLLGEHDWLLIAQLGFCVIMCAVMAWAHKKEAALAAN